MVVEIRNPMLFWLWLDDELCEDFNLREDRPIWWRAELDEIW